MTYYNEDEYLQLSGIQHYAFCKRQWALAYIELQWDENLRTVEGKILHENAHNPFSNEKRKDIIISRAMPIHSAALGVSGECDVVEFHRSANGVSLYGREGRYDVVPIEYKRGEPKKDDMDELQLTAQAICLEEMLVVEHPISYGYLFYGETMHRCKVEFTEALRNKVEKEFCEMHALFQKRYVPKVKRTKSCNACSLKDLCLPVLLKDTSVENYIEQQMSDKE